MTAATILPGPDLDPIEAARRLAGRPGRFLLHSASDADGVGRWSFAGADPSRTLILRDAPDALAQLDALVAGAADDHDPFPRPLAVGWLSYDLGRTLEPHAQLSPGAVDDLQLPDLAFGAYPAIRRRDGATGRCEVVGEPAAAAALHALLSAAASAAGPGPAPAPAPALPGPAPDLGPLLADQPDAAHLAAISRALDYIRAGDIYQVNLARRLRATCTPGDLLPLYQAAARVAPAPYGALVELADTAVISNSPELFLRRAPGAARVETRPIKGTRARGRDAAADAALATELARDPKELAEHLMIVDLLRNDLGRVATLGSVRVDDYARVLQLPTVHHLVSTVSATLPASTTTAELLAACFPGGSITGAPKIRAMQIIDELEPVRRGPYTGVIGYLGARGALDLAIAIRTLVVARGALHLHVGGGIVADSSPARELEETEEKAAAWRAALASLTAGTAPARS